MPRAAPTYRQRLKVAARNRRDKAEGKIRDLPNRDRQEAALFYASAPWRRLRRWFLNRNTLCADPFGTHADAGTIVPAEHVDHIKPRRDRPDLAFNPENLQALCHSCHSRKTRQETAEKQETPSNG